MLSTRYPIVKPAVVAFRAIHRAVGVKTAAAPVKHHAIHHVGVHANTHAIAGKTGTFHAVAAPKAVVAKAATEGVRCVATPGALPAGPGAAGAGGIKGVSGVKLGGAFTAGAGQGGTGAMGAVTASAGSGGAGSAVAGGIGGFLGGAGGTLAAAAVAGTLLTAGAGLGTYTAARYLEDVNAYNSAIGPAATTGAMPDVSPVAPFAAMTPALGSGLDQTSGGTSSISPTAGGSVGDTTTGAGYGTSSGVGSGSGTNGGDGTSTSPAPTTSGLGAGSDGKGTTPIDSTSNTPTLADQATAVPEPATLLIFTLGSAGAILVRRRARGAARSLP